METALERFIQARPNRPAPQVRWLPFQLNPDLPAEGMSRADYLHRKFGSPDGGDMYERIKAEGTKVGLPFDFSSIARQPNTLKAHALVAAAAPLDVQSQVKEALMKAFFCEGADLTQDAHLQAIARAAGMPPATAHAVLQDAAGQQKVVEQDAQLRRMGISGVPYFIINRQIGVSGAQPSENLLAAMEQAMAAVDAA
jgi:predicted DsbA family dithiol-disulfide isomerase